jgi:hypothetical protein
MIPKRNDRGQAHQPAAVEGIAALQQQDPRSTPLALRPAGIGWEHDINRLGGHREEETFARWQPLYAAHGIATFPVKLQNGGKVPAVIGYLKVGLRGSAELAVKFAASTSWGWACGPRNRLLVIDMDSTDEAIVPEGERLFGVSPVLWRTGGGKFAMAFRHNGEGRSIRPIPGVDIDALGGGFAMAPPSAGIKQRYEFLRGTLADFDRLPIARMPKDIANNDVKASERQQQHRIPKGTRNSELFRYCSSIVARCDTLDQLIDTARTWAHDYLAVELSETEIVKTCNSAWQFRGGRRRIMDQWFEGPQWQALTSRPEVAALAFVLLGENRANGEFMIANGLGPSRGWSRSSVPAARKFMLELGIIECVRHPRRGAPALYRWAQPGANGIPDSVSNPLSPSPPFSQGG